MAIENNQSWKNKIILKTKMKQDNTVQRIKRKQKKKKKHGEDKETDDGEEDRNVYKFI